MNTNIHMDADKEDKPLTRADIESLLHTVGSSDELDLSGRNLKGINLALLDLSGANMIGADLTGAYLNGVKLNGAKLNGAKLAGATLSGVFSSRANLSDVNMSKARLSGADLSGANLSDANLVLANLSGTDLSGANLSKAYLSDANLSSANLSKANLNEANLSGAYLRNIDLKKTFLTRAYLLGAVLSQEQKEQLRGKDVLGLDESNFTSMEETKAIRIRIVEEPLTAQNLITIISAITELYTKCWLITKGRYADLIEYTQTRNGRFAEEAQAVVTRITYNSPMNMDWKVDMSAPSIAEALVKGIDGITQVRKRLEKVELENQAKAQEVKYAEQHADQELQMAAIEREKQLLEVEQRRLEVLERRLDVQKKGIEYALDIASKIVDTLHPNIDPAVRAMEIQVLLPSLLQLNNGKGLELALPLEYKDPENGGRPKDKS